MIITTKQVNRNILGNFKLMKNEIKNFSLVMNINRKTKYSVFSLRLPLKKRFKK